MKCPKCDSDLVKKFYKGMMEVDSCPNCRGIWLDCDELDTLEDVTFDDDEWKGSLIHSSTLTSHRCPHCENPLHQFQYRLYDLTLDYCAENGHGFWLDAGEEVRIMEKMQQRAKEVERKLAVEMEWQQTLRRFRAKSFFDRHFKKN